MTWIVENKFGTTDVRKVFDTYDEAYRHFVRTLFSPDVAERISWFGQSYVNLYEEKND